MLLLEEELFEGLMVTSRLGVSVTPAAPNCDEILPKFELLV